jgi:hypothetical protein
MSQETTIDSLPGGISDEDSKLVDSILNDLNMSGGGSANTQQVPQVQRPPVQQEQLSPEQMKQIQIQRQMAMQQQQNLMHQQNMMQQQQLSQQKINNISVEEDNLIDSIKKESKGIILVIILSILVNLESVDNLFKMQPTLFVSESGNINMQAVLVKALLIGLVYYVVKSQFF